MSDNYQIADNPQVLTFKKCTLAKLDKTFGLQQERKLPALENWLAGQADISELERLMLALMQDRLIANVHDWNEEELSQFFIGPLFMLVNFTTKSFNIFAERSLAGVVDGIEMRGEPDGMIASGFREPEKPYFCFQEYKRHKDPDGDPAAQCLAAMLIAQVLNEAEQPIYGCSVIGYDWVFMVLQGKNYAMSTSFVATRDDIFDIFRILKVLKQIITELVTVNNLSPATDVPK